MTNCYFSTRFTGNKDHPLQPPWWARVQCASSPSFLKRVAHAHKMTHCIGCAGGILAYSAIFIAYEGFRKSDGAPERAPNLHKICGFKLLLNSVNIVRRCRCFIYCYNELLPFRRHARPELNCAVVSCYCMSTVYHGSPLQYRYYIRVKIQSCHRLSDLQSVWSRTGMETNQGKMKTSLPLVNMFSMRSIDGSSLLRQRLSYA